MASINKLKNGKFQVKVRLKDRSWVTKTFEREKDARAFGLEKEREKSAGNLVSNEFLQLTVDEYFKEWLELAKATGSKHHRKNQEINFRKYISPVIGLIRLSNVTSPSIGKVLSRMIDLKKSDQTRRHVYNLLNKMYGDAIHVFRYSIRNPMVRDLKPKVPIKEALFLPYSDALRLLEYCKDKPYGFAIWVQLLLGLRVGELIALEWDRDVDMTARKVRISHVFIAYEKTLKDHPKSRKQRTVVMLPDLVTLFAQQKLATTSKFVVTGSSPDKRLSRRTYCKKLRKYCKDLNIAAITSHGLRHSTSEIYIEHGATEDDIRKLLGHESVSTTERYMHGRGSNLERVAGSISLFKDSTLSPSLRKSK